VGKDAENREGPQVRGDAKKVERNKRVPNDRPMIEEEERQR